MLDSGVAESPDALQIDPIATIERARAMMGRRRQLVAEETAVLRAIRPRLVLADIPYLAGEAARMAGIRCAGVSNFTWNWIVEPFLEGDRELAQIMEDGYGAMDTLLQLPFGQNEGVSMFGRVERLGLVSGRVRNRIDASNGRKRIWVALRGDLSRPAMQRAANQCSEYLFLTNNPHYADAAPNVETIDLDVRHNATDLVRSTDAVLGKLGYSLVSECVAAKTPLVHVTRTGFREDVITRVQAPRYTVLEEMPVEEFADGNWRPYLERAMEAPIPGEIHPGGGAAAAGEWIASAIG
jgi:hypothetical protein